ncbi:MAG: 2Fe-2S iron-sulfur cluster-binding protein, partial [Limisphaerales bacterium]
MTLRLTVDGEQQEAETGEHLLELLNRLGVKLPQVCYHQQLGPVQTCDTCLVESDGRLVRACATPAADGMKVFTKSNRAQAAQREAFDRILADHLLYCTVCDNNNGNCAVHNTTELLAVEHQRVPFKPKPFEVDSTNPFYRYD